MMTAPVGSARKLSTSAGRYNGTQAAGGDASTTDIQTPLPQEFTASTSPAGGSSPQDPAAGALGAPVIRPPNQLPDGQGGAVAVPPPQMAPGAAYAPRIPGFAGHGVAGAQPIGAPAPTMAPPPPRPIGAPAPQMGATAQPIGAPAPQTAFTAAPAGVAGAPPPAGGSPATEQFGPGSNLIDTQINATSDPRTLNLQALQDAQLNKVLNGPDRNAMAREQYNTWEQDTAPDFAHSISDATDAAAAHGQIRSGQLTNRYGDLARQRVLDETTARSRYMQNALEGSIGDTQRGLEDVSGAEGRSFNEGAASRDELRGERGYESSKAEQALLNRIQQYQAETGAQNTNFAQGADLYGLGNEGNPYGAYAAASGQASGEAENSMSDIGALLQAMARRRATNATA